MKKILSFTFILYFRHSWAQTTNVFLSSGNVGVGTVTPNFNMQLHGTTDYIVNFPAQPPMYDMFGNLVTPGSPAYSFNYGKHQD